MKRIGPALALLLCHTVAHAGRLNDTGLRSDQWASDSQFGTNDFSPLNYIEAHAPRQDSYYGRDPAHAAGALFKVGGGDQGFDFTRLCGNGDEEGTGTCPPGLTADDLGSGDAQWACTRDNVTGLTWELKTVDGGLQDRDWQYSWYNTDAASNGGNAGTQTPSSNPTQCGSFLTNCNTEEYVAAINALNDGAGLCGFTDWRMPHVPEMTNVAHLGETRREPGIGGDGTLEQLDADYFPFIRGTSDIFHYYWSATPKARDPNLAWPFGFHRSHYIHPGVKSASWYVVLVRGED